MRWRWPPVRRAPAMRTNPRGETDRGGGAGRGGGISAPPHPSPAVRRRARPAHQPTQRDRSCRRGQQGAPVAAIGVRVSSRSPGGTGSSAREMRMDGRRRDWANTAMTVEPAGAEGMRAPDALFRSVRPVGRRPIGPRAPTQDTATPLTVGIFSSSPARFQLSTGPTNAPTQRHAPAVPPARSSRLRDDTSPSLPQGTASNDPLVPRTTHGSGCRTRTRRGAGSAAPDPPPQARYGRQPPASCPHGHPDLASPRCRCRGKAGSSRGGGARRSLPR